MSVRSIHRTLAVGLTLVGAIPSALQAQGDPLADPDSTGAERAMEMIQDGHLAPVPFGPGEALRYKVKWGIFNIGDGALEVTQLDTVRGFPAYHISMRLKGGKLGMNVDDHHQSWIDVRSFVSRRFIQDIDEVNYERYRHYEFYPEENWYERADLGERDDLASPLPLDDIAFVYFARTLPLNVGEVYTVPRYFKESGNPVVIRVLRKEVKEVPAGTFNTVVVQPIIKSRGMFGEDGNAELYFTDDERRILVYMKSDMSIGNLTLHLEELEEGTPLRPLEISRPAEEPDSNREGVPADAGAARNPEDTQARPAGGTSS